MRKAILKTLHVLYINTIIVTHDLTVLRLHETMVGVTGSIFSAPLKISKFFHNRQNNSFLLDITFIFDKSHFSLSNMNVIERI